MTIMASRPNTPDFSGDQALDPGMRVHDMAAQDQIPPLLESAPLFAEHLKFAEASRSLGDIASEDDLERVRQGAREWFLATDQAGRPADGRIGGVMQYLMRHHPASVKYVDLAASAAFLNAYRAFGRDKASGRLPLDLEFPVDGDLADSLLVLRYVPEDMRPLVVDGLGEDMVSRLAPAPDQERGSRLMGAVRGVVAMANRLLHRRRSSSAIGHAALADEVLPEASVATGEVISLGGTYGASDGRTLQLRSFMDIPQNARLVAQADEGQRAAYKREGVWKPDATGSPVRGQNVEVVSFIDPEAESDDPITALRKVHAETWEEVTRMPSFVKLMSEGAFFEGGLELFQQLATGRPVVEIAGLWKDESCPADVRLALYREAVQESIAKGELWFMGVVGTVYRELNDSWGQKVVHTIGRRITVHDDDASRKTSITPILIDPRTLYADLVADVKELSASGDTRAAQKREMMLWEILRGEDLDSLDPDVIVGLKELMHV